MERAVRTPVWSRLRTAARGPKPSLTLARIVDAAVELADTEGPTAVSMRRLAAELGVGTMSLYRYIETKDDLLDLMTDQVMAEQVQPQSQPMAGGASFGGWRQRLRGYAVRHREVLLHHPWVLGVTAARPPLGPNTLRATEQLLGTLDGLGLGVDELSQYSGTVVAYVRGVALTEIAEAEAVRRTGQTEGEYRRAAGPYLRGVLEQGRHPLLARLIAEGAHHPDPQRVFEHGLDRVLDGIEAGLRVPSGR